MIHAAIYQNKRKECTGFQIEGHAGYSEEGQDIVCAAVSLLVINTMNAIELYAEDEFSVVSEEEDGRIAFHLAKAPSKEAQLLLKTMVLGLSGMAENENYKNFIDLAFEEVQKP